MMMIGFLGPAGGGGEGRKKVCSGGGEKEGSRGMGRGRKRGINHPSSSLFPPSPPIDILFYSFLPIFLAPPGPFLGGGCILFWHGMAYHKKCLGDFFFFSKGEVGGVGERGMREREWSLGRN